MPKCLIMLDNSNVFIEGKRFLLSKKAFNGLSTIHMILKTRLGAWTSVSSSLSWRTVAKFWTLSWLVQSPLKMIAFGNQRNRKALKS